MRDERDGKSEDYNKEECTKCHERTQAFIYDPELVHSECALCVPRHYESVFDHGLVAWRRLTLPHCSQAKIQHGDYKILYRLPDPCSRISS